MRNNKIRAYTLLEITIAMLLSAVVISMTYTIFHIVGGALRDFIKRNTAVIMVSQLDQALGRDFRNSTSAFRDDTGLHLSLDTDSVVYVFQPGMIIRRKSAIDTFRINPGSVNMTFEHKPTEGPGEKVDDIQFDSSLENRVIHLHYSKIYSSSELFKADSNAIHRPKGF